MAGAGLRLNELYAGEGERGLLLRGENLPQPNLRRVKAWVPLHRQENILRRNEAKDNRKIPLVRSPVWARRQGILPAADANTVRSPTPTDSCSYLQLLDNFWIIWIIRGANSIPTNRFYKPLLYGLFCRSAGSAGRQVGR